MQTDEGEKMTHISEIIPRVLGSEDSKLSSPDQMVETRIEECHCLSCGTTFQGEVTIYRRFTPPRELRQRECPKCRAKRQEREERERQQELERQRQELRARWRLEYGMPVWLLTKTFDNFEQQYQEAAYKMALDWARGFDLDSPAGYPTLIFYSSIPGVGKGHLMSAIVNYVLANWKGNPKRVICPIRFESGPSLVRRIRATFNLRKDDFSHEHEDEVYRSLAGVPLLLLDDVGKEKPSDFTRETYWFIINERVTTGLPVIVSSRLEFEGEHSLETLMHEDTVSRLYGMARGQFIKMKGADYRKLKGIA